ncbi:MAG: hypothetical protein ACPL4I_11530, partial [Bacteroidota bacterium]
MDPQSRAMKRGPLSPFPGKLATPGPAKLASLKRSSPNITTTRQECTHSAQRQSSAAVRVWQATFPPPATWRASQRALPRTEHGRLQRVVMRRHLWQGALQSNTPGFHRDLGRQGVAALTLTFSGNTPWRARCPGPHAPHNGMPLSRAAAGGVGWSGGLG